MYGVAAGVVEAQLQNLRTLKAWLMRKIERTVDEGAVRALLRLNDDLNANLEKEESRLVAQVPCWVRATLWRGWLEMLLECSGGASFFFLFFFFFFWGGGGGGAP
jgi:hypothetical protein